MPPISLSLRCTALALAGALTWSGAVPAATTVVECVEPDGTVTFRQWCPPGAEVRDKRRVTTAPAAEPDLEEISREHPITFYSVGNCDACDLVRVTLERRGVPYNEIDAAADAAAQERLTDLTGKVNVPVVTVGDTVIQGFRSADIAAALDAAGYPDAEVEAAAQAAAD